MKRLRLTSPACHPSESAPKKQKITEQQSHLPGSQRSHPPKPPQFTCEFPPSYRASLLSLSAEIREQIYLYVLPTALHGWYPHSLLLTNKQLHHEFKHLIYSRCTLVFRKVPDDISFLEDWSVPHQSKTPIHGSSQPCPISLTKLSTSSELSRLLHIPPDRFDAREYDKTVRFIANPPPRPTLPNPCSHFFAPRK